MPWPENLINKIAINKNDTDEILEKKKQMMKKVHQNKTIPLMQKIKEYSCKLKFFY